MKSNLKLRLDDTSLKFKDQVLLQVKTETRNYGKILDNSLMIQATEDDEVSKKTKCNLDILV